MALFLNRRDFVSASLADRERYAPRPARRRALDFGELEERVLLSASPLPMPSVAETAASSQAVTQDASASGVSASVSSQAELSPTNATAADTSALANNTPAPLDVRLARDVVLIDSQLTDSETLRQAARLGSHVFVYNSLTDSANTVLSEVIAWAEQSGESIQTLSVLGHGVGGAFELGNQWITTSNLSQTADDWQRLGQLMVDDADIELYGCNVAALGTDGQNLLDQIAALTGAAVFASIDTTGWGGNWDLEAASNGAAAELPTLAIPFDAPLLDTYAGTLATIAIDSTTSDMDSSGGTTSLTWSHTVGSGANRILIVSVATEGGTAVSSITYGGTALTVIGTATHPTGHQAHVELWYLQAPAVGTANVVLTLSSGDMVTAGATSFFGVDQGTPISAFALADGSGGNPTLAVPSAVGEFVVDVVAQHSGTSGTPGSGQTELYHQSTGSGGSDVWGSSSTEAGASSVTMSWSISGSGAGEWAAAAVSLVPASTPSINAPASSTLNEDASRTFTSAGGNAISISDATAGGGMVEAHLTVINGTLALSGTAGLTFVSGSDGTGAMTIQGTLTNINAALDGLLYTPIANYAGGDSLAVDYSDLGAGGSGTKTATSTVALTVNPVNDPPVNSAPPAVSTLVNVPIVFSTANGNALSVDDVDAGNNPLQITLSSTHGLLTLNGTAGLSFTSGDGTSDATMTFTGTLANINAALSGLQYAPTAGYGGNATITLSSVDQGWTGAGGSQSAVNTIDVQMLNTSDTLVNATTTDTQHEVATAMDTVGNYVVVWTSEKQDGNGKGVYGQRFDSGGNKVGGEFRVNTTTANDQNAATVAMNGNGSFVVAWVSKNQDGDKLGIYAQRFNSSGVKQGAEFLVNALTTGDQDMPSVAIAASGNFVVAWHTDQGNNIKARRFDAAGVAQGSEFLVNTTTTKTDDQPRVAMDSSGNFVVVWRATNADTSGAGVFGQRYNAAGVAQGGEFLINTTQSGDQNRPSVAMDSSGAFVVTWTSGHNQDGDDRGIFAQRFNAAGVSQGGELQINTHTAKDQDWSSVSIDSGGNFVVAWMSKDQDGDKLGVYAQKFASDGSTIGGEFLVNLTTKGDQMNPALAGNAAGDFAIAWEGNGVGDAQGVFTRAYNNANPLPIINVPAAQATNEDTVRVLSSGNANVISISDADAGAGIVEVSLAVSHGSLTLSGIAGLTFISGGNGTGAMTVQGTLTNINAALDGLLYTPAANYAGSESLIVDYSDLGVGGGGTQTTSSAVALTVNPVNDAPLGADNSILTAQGTPYTFSLANFVFSDTSDNPTNNFQGIWIANLSVPLLASLTENGFGVSNGQFVSAASITAGNLVFTPALLGLGANYASFDYQVQDSGGTANGGNNVDPSPKVMQIDVFNNNNAPVLSGANNLATINENAFNNSLVYYSRCTAG